MNALTLHEVAEELRISYDHVRRLIAVEQLPHVRLGKRIIVRREALEAWIAGRERGGAA